MTFQDTTAQEAYLEPLQHQDQTFKVQDSTDASLGSYLSRPVLIATVPWDVGNSLNLTFDPWASYYNNVRVQKKVEGFYLQRFDLKIKLLINGSPFYYGKVLASYNPMGQNDNLDLTATASVNKLITRSQRNHIVLDATDSVGGVISCPYFYPYAYQKIKDAFSEMGLLNLDSFTPLNNSNGANSTVYIQIYCWAENVVLSIPTVDTHQAPLSLVSHSDEYSSSDRITKKSNASASLDGVMTKTVPKITKYALATAQCVEALSGLALMFGFSRPPVLEKQKFVKNLIFGNVANADAPECLHKLTLDSKQELTIDPRTVGIEPIDELQLSNIVTRESYLSQFDWSPASPNGQILWSSRVMPHQYALEVVQPGSSRVTPTLLSYVTQLFNYWTGDMEYRFSVVASRYHKGRLLIVYDPSPPLSASTVPDSNSVYSRVIDISEVKEFVVRISYSQDEPYMVINSNRQSANLLGVVNGGVSYGPSILNGVISNSSLGSNGTLSVYVLNPLLNPSASDTGNPVVLVHTRGCENMKFAGTRSIQTAGCGSILPNVQPLELESHSLESPADVIQTTTMAKVQDVDPYPLVWFGETFDSLRTLLKRYNFYLSYYPAPGTWGTLPAASSNVRHWHLLRSNIPQHVGYDVNGFAGTGSAKYFPGKMTTLSYVMAMFVGCRGGIRYKYACSNVTNSQIPGSLTVSRVDQTDIYYSDVVNISVGTAINPVWRLDNDVTTAAGAMVTDTFNQPVAEVELPYYANNRFTYVRGSVSVSGNSSNPASPPARFARVQSHRVDMNVPISGDLSPYAIDAYVSVGEDFQLFWLLSAPCTYIDWAGD